ncbi:hypothetical protein ACZ87_01717, partial [Candidatus Erwinia dacicola]
MPALAQDGGIQKAMWAGGPRRSKRNGDSKRMILSATMNVAPLQGERHSFAVPV